jgi:polyphosphate kinase
MQSEGVSENIELKSIVGRYLEHGRLFIFHNDGNPQTYISSADWMTRNLDKRIEVTVPIIDESIQAQLSQVFELEWSDNVKSRVLDDRQLNRYWKSEGKRVSVHQKLYLWYKSK